MLWRGPGPFAALGDRPTVHDGGDRRSDPGRGIPLRTRRYRAARFEPRAIARGDAFASAKPDHSVALERIAASEALGRGPNCGIKRAFDLAFALVAIVVLLPLFAIVAIAIKFDTPGPIFFRQWRGGLNGQCFQILKFRTMTCMEEGLDVRQARPGDVRVTRVGRALRMTSIDELPQLFNVLQGEMSVVGPRPHALIHDAIYSKSIPVYPDRHAVKPGITGWAQVNGCRGETRDLAAMQKRIERDLEYIRKWSLWLDLVIIAMTAKELLHPRNAY